jgi:Protein of unknown function (DUF3489)
MDVVNAVITAQGEITMNANTETETAPTAEKPKPTKKATAGARRAHVAASKPKSGKKATPAKKTPKPRTPAAGAKPVAGARGGSKTAKVRELLKRPGGVTTKELMKATGWQPHSVRGFLSGTVGKKMGLAVVSAKGEDGERTYSVKA